MLAEQDARPARPKWMKKGPRASGAPEVVGAHGLAWLE